MKYTDTEKLKAVLDAMIAGCVVDLPIYRKSGKTAMVTSTPGLDMFFCNRDGSINKDLNFNTPMTAKGLLYTCSKLSDEYIDKLIGWVK